ncbi:restriction endonuclease [Candidatus Bathyarchaeota archaeon]|nr:restriction endonuclease [Candidatus Bathyarchaeota archaeon]
MKINSNYLYGSYSKEDLENLYKLSLQEPPDQKGGRFEEFVEKFFSKIEGFEVSRDIPAYHTDIDVFIKNKSTDPYLSKLGEHIIVQCKNVKKPIKNAIIISVVEQAKLLGGTCRYAVLATTSKLSKVARSRLYAVNQQGPPCVVVIDGGMWREYFNRPEMREKELFEKAIETLPTKYR